jgi:hypothetical protein
VTIGLGLGATVTAQGAVSAQQQKMQARDDQKENSTREAHNSFTIVSQGIGTVKLAQPVTFDCQFIEEPRITSGVAIVVAPNEKLYNLPQTTVGVYQWVKKPQQPVADHDVNGNPITDINGVPTTLNTLTGAGVTGTVINDSEDQVPMYYTGAYLYFRIACDPLGSTTELQVEQAPATPILHQHITFTGTAMKALSETITGSADDPSVPPRTSTVAGTDAGTDTGTDTGTDGSST